MFVGYARSRHRRAGGEPWEDPNSEIEEWIRHYRSKQLLDIIPMLDFVREKSIKLYYEDNHLMAEFDEITKDTFIERFGYQADEWVNTP